MNMREVDARSRESMNQLIQTLKHLRVQLPSLQRRELKETPTRTILIDPILQALGWDVRDPDEVELEYPTCDSKSVDYALKINEKAVLLVEAKALGDPLNDVKAITQIVGYAANDGITWCVLTNGAVWRVYRSVEKCPAPDKLMFEVSIDPRESPDTALKEVVSKLWRISREEMAKGTLDELGEQTFTDSKVRKALETIMRDATLQLVNIVRKAAHDEALTPQRVRASLARICCKDGLPDKTSARKVTLRDSPVGAESEAPLGTKGRRRARGGTYDEAHHTQGKPREAVELYRAIDRFCMSLAPGVQKRYHVKHIGYAGPNEKRQFCTVHLQQAGLRVWLNLKYSRLVSPPSFARDVSGIGHWGVGDIELRIDRLALVEDAAPLIRQAFEECK